MALALMVTVSATASTLPRSFSIICSNVVMAFIDGFYSPLGQHENNKMNNELVEMDALRASSCSRELYAGIVPGAVGTMDVSVEGWASFAPLATSCFSPQTQRA